MNEPALVIALVGVIGIGAQWIAWRTGWPAIALMLVAGVLAGPVFQLFDPQQAFGELLDPMISIGVALILFEGGLSLDFRELRQAGDGVWRLVLFGVPLGWLFGSLATHFIAGLAWPVAILFAGILVVTGPTVVIPLLRQVSIQPRPARILKWEGIVNDPVGALCAVIAYEYFRLSADGATLFEVVPPMIIAAGLAAVAGYAVARLIAFAFPRGLVPEFLKVPVLLVAVVATFVACNAIEHEAGLVAVTVMGVALANRDLSSLRSIHPFKQNVAVLLVSGIFVLLSASIEWETFKAFEWRFGAFLLALLFLVRPATVLLSLLFSSIPWNERLFLAWVAPRGIVLVAISGLFALRLSELGYSGGSVLIGLSFAVVGSTILAHGFTARIVARLLKVGSTSRPGLLIVGGNQWSVALAQEMQELKVPVLIVDANWHALAAARQSGLPTYHGEVLNKSTEYNLDLVPYEVLIAATANEAYNALVCNEFAHEIGRDAVYQLGEDPTRDDPRSLPDSITGQAVFDSGISMAELRMRQAEGWKFRKTRLSEQFGYEQACALLPEGSEQLMLLREDGSLRFFTHLSQPEPAEGDVVISYCPPESAADSAKDS